MTNAKFRLSALTISAILLGTSLAPRATADFTWDGGAVDDLFTSDDNWVGDVAPGLNLSGMLLVFGPVGVDQQPDIGADKYTNIGGIRFTGADAIYRIIGTGTLNFVDEASIINDSLFDHIIAVDIEATGAVLRIDAMTGNLELSGAINLADTLGVQLQVMGDNDTQLGGIISGSGGSILKEGAGALTLLGANTFTGGVELNEGTILLANDEALGTGALTVTGDSTLESGSDDVRITNSIEIFQDTELTLGGAFDLAFANPSRITGEGSILIDADADDVVFAFNRRNNTYTGGTSLRRGILEIGASNVLGSGDLTVHGTDGTIRSVNDNNSLNNNIELRSNAVLTFGGNDNLTLNGIISGLGGLTVDTDANNARLILNGANTYEGGTILNRGTISLGSNTALGTGDLTLTGNGTLRSSSAFRVIENRIRLGSNTLSIRGNFGLTIDAKISGSGGLDVDFSDTDTRLVLLRENTFTGLTNVTGGILQLDGAVGGDVNIDDEGMLIGEGDIGGSLTVADGGQVSPGLSVGTLTIDGNFELGDEGTYVVEIDTVEDESDLLDIAGTAVLRDGSQIEASVSGTTFAPTGAQYTIIMADGGITDEGVEIVNDSATLTFTLIRNTDFMDGDTIFALEVLRDADAYSDVADAGNNLAIGMSLDSLVPIAEGDPDGDAADLLGALDALDEDGYNNALNELSPEPYNAAVELTAESAKLFNLELSRYLSTRRSGIATWQQAARAMAPRPGALVMANNDPAIIASAIAQMEAAEEGEEDTDVDDSEKSYSIFGQFAGSLFDVDSDGDRTGYDVGIFGGQAGIDWQINDNTIFGVAAGYTYGDADWDNNRGSLENNSLRIGPYVSYARGPWYVDASLTFGYHFLESDRAIPTLTRNVSADFNAWDVTGYVGGGYQWEVRRNVFFTPNASVQYSYMNFDSFDESGGGGADLSVDSRDESSLRSRIGAELSCKLDVGPVIMPSVYGGWEREWAGDNDDIDAGFAAGGIPFSVSTGPRLEDSFYVGFGVNVLFHRDVAGFLRFEKTFGDDIDGGNVAGGLTFSF